MAVRSVRNNNPGNIRTNSTAWKGKTGDDGAFVSFATPEHGVRALGRTLETYQDKHGLNTVEGIIQRWAPPNENDTTGYVDFVASKMGIDKDASIDLSANPELAEKMVSAMIQKEGGQEALDYFGDSIEGGLGMAYGTQPDGVPVIDDDDQRELISNGEVIQEPEVEGISDIEDKKRNAIKSSASLAELIQNMEAQNLFWENELDAFEHYTYNLDLFIVNQQEANKFLAYEQTPQMMDDIVNDAWPTNDMNVVTIARTGITTELNITDLTVTSVGQGTSTASKMAGTATNLQFTISQVGGTSLPDMLNNSILICGYPDLQNATFFMKVRFKGYDNDGNVVKNLPATKIFPFVITKYNELQSVTESKGTNLVIDGTIVNDKVIADSDLSQMEYNFEFDVADTLQETLENFFKKLNEKVVERSIVGDSEFINDYKFEMDDNFKQMFAQGQMTSPDEANKASGNNETSKKNSVKIGQQTGVITPGSSIYNAIESICLNSKEIREALTDEKPKLSNLFRILPHARPKLGGYNVLTSKQTYEVTYFLTVQKALIVQNQLHSAKLTEQTAKILSSVFLEGHCNKRYYYQYTGRNEHILDLTISLSNQLQKAYVLPSDAYMANSFLETVGDWRNEIDSRAEQKLTELEGQATGLKDGIKMLKTASNQYQKRFDDLNNEIKNEFKERVKRRITGPDNAVDSNVADILNAIENADANQMLEMFDEDSEEYEIINEIFKGEVRENYNKLHNQIQETRTDLNQTLVDQKENEVTQNEVMREALGHLYSTKIIESTNMIGDNWNELGLFPGSEGQELILSEDLDKEMINKLSKDQFSSLLKALVENPINFSRITKSMLSQPTNLNVIKSPDQENIEVAMEKYYEGRNNNLSMLNVNMTIKGDPYWVDSILSPSMEKAKFGNKNSLEDYKMHLSKINGCNYLMLVSDKAEDVFLNDPNRVGQDSENYDGIKKTRLITSVYSVQSVISSFSGGLFTQTLGLVKLPAAEEFVKIDATLDAPEPELVNLDVAQMEIQPLLGVNDPGNGLENPNEKADIEAKEFADDIVAPAGAGTGVTPEGDRYIVDVSATGPHAVMALQNATTNFLDPSNQNDYAVPNESVAKQLALARQQAEGLCALGHQQSCVAVQQSANDIAKRLADDYQTGNNSVAESTRNAYNESIDNGYIVSAQTMAEIDHALEASGNATIGTNVTGVDQNELDAINDANRIESERYVKGNDDIKKEPLSIMDNLEVVDADGTATNTEKANSVDGPNAILDGDVELNNLGFSSSHDAYASGRMPRSYNVNVEGGTLTANEADKVSALNQEAQDIIDGRGLHDLTDQEYAEVKTIEKSIDTITENATSGIRGDAIQGVKDQKKLEVLTSKESELDELNDDIDNGFYFTGNYGRNKDRAKAEVLQAEVNQLRSDLDTSEGVTTGVIAVEDASGDVTYEKVTKPIKAPNKNAPIPVVETLGDSGGTAINNVEGAVANGQISQTQVNQYNSATSVYNELIEKAEAAPRATITETVGGVTMTEEVLDFSAIGPITYTNSSGQEVTVTDPATHFGLVDGTAAPGSFDYYKPGLNSKNIKQTISNEYPDVAISPNRGVGDVNDISNDEEGGPLKMTVKYNEGDFVVVNPPTP